MRARITAHGGVRVIFVAIISRFVIRARACLRDLRNVDHDARSNTNVQILYTHVLHVYARRGATAVHSRIDLIAGARSIGCKYKHDMIDICIMLYYVLCSIHADIFLSEGYYVYY